MCIVLISTAHPTYPLILIDNRDEYLTRPTAPASWWPSPNDHILAARDLLKAAHGTWLGVTRHGRIAVLTNFREEDQPASGVRSRGAMVKAFLTVPSDQEESTEDFAKHLLEGDGVKGVGGFSLLFGQLKSSKHGKIEPMAVISNRTPDVEGLTWIGGGVKETHGLSNAAYGDRSWSKVVRGEQLMKEAVEKSITEQEDSKALIGRLMRLLSTETLPKRTEGEQWQSYVRQLRNSIFVPAIAGEGMDEMSADEIVAAKSGKPISLRGGDTSSGSDLGTTGIYGTQKQTVVLCDLEGMVTFVERTLYDDAARPIELGKGDRHFEFRIQ
ncbi:MAG: hypothetical protein M1827_005846 [Pycnora praestabilis]|nr:MAG: hypothetical protein M1827_005846 [Pycnora praestabilis]